MPVQGNSFFSFTFSVIFVVSVSGFRDASFTFFFVQKNTKGTICNNQCIRICERLIIINYIELIIIIIFRIFAKIRFIVITTVNPKKKRTFTSIDLAAWKIPCIRFIVCGEFAFPIITPIVYLFSIRMLPFHKSLFSFYFTIFFAIIQYILVVFTKLFKYLQTLSRLQDSTPHAEHYISQVHYEVISCDIQKLPPGLFQSAVIFIFCYSDFMISRLSLP